MGGASLPPYEGHAKQPGRAVSGLDPFSFCLVSTCADMRAISALRRWRWWGGVGRGITGCRNAEQGGLDPEGVAEDHHADVCKQLPAGGDAHVC